ncbi:MAG: sulfurtransferase [Herpetosiphon sp.]
MRTIDLPVGPLVSTEWLAQHVGDERLRIVDVRGLVKPPGDPKPHYFARRDLYEAGHITGAVFVDWTRDIVDLDDPIPVQIAGPAQYVELMARLGIGDDTPVVAYDASLPFFAARFLWTLRYYGHESARVLDGGFAKWQAEGRPVETIVPSFPVAQFTARPQVQLRRTVDQVFQGLHGPGIVIDGRSPTEYRGEESRADRGGHIPGAINIFYRDMVEGQFDTFAPPEVLRARFAEAGVAVDDNAAEDAVVYCNGGVTALVTALGMEVAGGRKAALYDGSWNEWGNREDLPIAGRDERHS